MEFGYAHAFEIQTFVLLHHLTYQQLIQKKSAPPALQKKQCNKAIEWESIESELTEVMGVNNG